MSGPPNADYTLTDDRPQVIHAAIGWRFRKKVIPESLGPEVQVCWLRPPLVR
jgi:hypothetical protein